MLPAGEAAALAAAMVWAATAIVFTRVGRETGPVAVNTFKTGLAALIFTAIVAVRAAGGRAHGIGGADAGLLALSGLIGLTLGDSLLFLSFLEMGPRRALLVFSLYPVMGAVGGRVFLGERLGAQGLAGMGLALAGVAWVILERPEREEGAGAGIDLVSRRGFAALRGPLTLGVLAALGAALGQSSGALIAKPALARVDTLSATWVRMSAGAVGLVVAGLAGRRFAAWRAGFARPGILAPMLAATLAGPVFGVWCMFYSLGHALTGVTLTLLATTPVWLMVINVAWHRERINSREVVGILLTMAGIAVLMVRPLTPPS
jgi:drug/metabolite transporter (DMT)-like permease